MIGASSLLFLVGAKKRAQDFMAPRPELQPLPLLLFLTLNIICLISMFHSSKNAYDLQKHVETHHESDAYSCDMEGCIFTARTLQTLRHHYKRAHVVGRLKYLLRDGKNQFFKM